MDKYSLNTNVAFAVPFSMKHFFGFEALSCDARVQFEYDFPNCQDLVGVRFKRYFYTFVISFIYSM